jgi:hypothetical protein
MAAQLGTTRLQTVTYKIKMRLNEAKQVRVSRWNPESIYRPIDANKLDF